jgi:four helix bundle protein
MTSDLTANPKSADAGTSRDKPRYDLYQRTERFGDAVIAFARLVPVNAVTRPLISQLVRAGTSVGANYGEADDADTRKDFRYRIVLCRREARESKYWLRRLLIAYPDLEPAAGPVAQEALELHLIFCAIIRSLDRNKDGHKG